MTEPTTDHVLTLAGMVGISITEQDLPEVANRFFSLMTELDTLTDIDLSGIQPVSVFLDESDPEV